MTNPTTDELKELTAACIKGVPDARRKFQDIFGDSIYKYPRKVFGLPQDKAGDFYVYVFERERVFRRLGTFEGRNEAQFKTYLCRYVLHDLFFEWQRNEKEIDTVPLDSIFPEGSSDGANIVAPSESSDDDDNVGSDNYLVSVLRRLDFEKRVILKLLCLAECDLVPEEIRFIAQKSARGYREVVLLVEHIRDELTKKDEQSAALQAQLDSVFGWILLYQKELAKIAERLGSFPPESPEHSKLHHQKDEWERKLEWRYRQQMQTREKFRQLRVTTPYKDIARLLNVPVGTVCSLIARTRGAIVELMGNRDVATQGVAP